MSPRYTGDLAANPVPATAGVLLDDNGGLLPGDPHALLHRAPSVIHAQADNAWALFRTRLAPRVSIISLGLRTSALSRFGDLWARG